MLGVGMAVKIVEDENCRSREEFRMELVSPRRTWRERFVDGPVWAPKPEFKEPRMMEMGIPLAFRIDSGMFGGAGITIIAHPEVAAEMRAVLASRDDRPENHVTIPGPRGLFGL